MSLAFAPQQGSSSQCSSEGKTQKKVNRGYGILKTWGCYWDWMRITVATRRKWEREELSFNNPATLLELATSPSGVSLHDVENVLGVLWVIGMETRTFRILLQVFAS